MGYDSRIYIGYAFPGNQDNDGRIRVYPEIVIDMPRLGWNWAHDVKTLRKGDQTYRLLGSGISDSEESDGVVADAYDVPLYALRPKALLRYLRSEHRDCMATPAMAALSAALRQVRKGKWKREHFVVIFYGC